MVVAETIAGLGAVKTAFDMAKALQNIHDAAARDRAVIDLQKEILSAQAEQFTLLQRVSDLEKQVAKLETWDADKKRYKLTELKSGVVAYVLKEGMEEGEPNHYLCAGCFHDNHKSFLQRQFWQPLRAVVYVCQDCGSVLYTEGHPHPDHKSMKPPAYRPS